MKDPKIRLRTFIGHQIESRFHSPAHFRAMGEALNRQLLEEGKTFKLDVEYGVFPPGSRLWDRIIESIEASQIAIFDISENNPNVLMEAGIALGTGKHVVFLKCEQSETIYPSDVRNFVFLPYHSSATLTEKVFLDSLIQSIDFFLDKNHDAHFYHKLLWSLLPNSRTLIIPGTLPEEHTGNIFEDYVHIRRFTDLDAVFSVVETIHGLYPQMDISIQSACNINQLPREWEQLNMVFIGGPDFNPIVGDFGWLSPVEYRYGKGNNAVWLLHKKTGKEYRPEFYTEGGQNRAKDYGFFLARTPLENGSARMIFIGGARTWGVYGAAMLVGCIGFDKKSRSYSNTRQLIERFGTNPSLLIPVEVTGSRDGIHPPNLVLEEVELLDD